MDSYLFIYYSTNATLYVLVYVDDILITGTNTDVIFSVINRRVFAIKDLCNIDYFLGMQAIRDSTGLHIRQSKYIMDLLHK
jgi:hypothetical protein